MYGAISKMELTVNRLEVQKKNLKDKVLKSLTERQFKSLTDKHMLDLTKVTSVASIKGFTHDSRTIESWLEHNIIDKDIEHLKFASKYLRTNKLTLDGEE